ncbi:MAG: hypothetical protein V8S22_10480, partial [Lachnospiraceae bacterium]
FLCFMCILLDRLGIVFLHQVPPTMLLLFCNSKRVDIPKLGIHALFQNECFGVLRTVFGVQCQLCGRFQKDIIDHETDSGIHAYNSLLSSRFSPFEFDNAHVLVEKVSPFLISH